MQSCAKFISFFSVLFVRELPSIEAQWEPLSSPRFMMPFPANAIYIEHGQLDFRSALQITVQIVQEGPVSFGE